MYIKDKEEMALLLEAVQLLQEKVKKEIHVYRGDLKEDRFAELCKKAYRLSVIEISLRNFKPRSINSKNV